MRGRQVGAFVLAAVLIGGAWLVRTQVIDGDADAAESQLAGIGMALTDPVDAPTSRGESSTSRGSEGNFAPRSRVGRGGVAAPSRGGESARNTKEIATDRANVAVAAQKPQNRKVNGHAPAEH